MATLLIAEHDNAGIKDATNKALTAATALGADVDVLVAGQGAKGAAEAAAKLAGVKKVLLPMTRPMRMISPSRSPTSSSSSPRPTMRSSRPRPRASRT